MLQSESVTMGQYHTIRISIRKTGLNWWDCVDVISSSGYYPIQDWEQELDRIEAVVKAYHKPVFLCRSRMYVQNRIKHVPNTGGLKEVTVRGTGGVVYKLCLSHAEKESGCKGMGCGNGRLQYHQQNRHIRMTVIKSARSRYRRL